MQSFFSLKLFFSSVSLMSSSSESSSPTSTSQKFYGCNMSSEDTLAYPTASRIQSPTAAFSPKYPSSDLGTSLNLTDSSATYHENDIEGIIKCEDGAHGRPNSRNTESNAIKKLYRLSQQTFSNISTKAWTSNKRDGMYETARNRNDTENRHIHIELGVSPHRASIEDKKKLISLMSQCLVRYGCPSHRIVSNLILNVPSVMNKRINFRMFSFGTGILTGSNGEISVDRRSIFLCTRSNDDFFRKCCINELSDSAHQSASRL